MDLPRPKPKRHLRTYEKNERDNPFQDRSSLRTEDFTVYSGVSSRFLKNFLENEEYLNANAKKYVKGSVGAGFFGGPTTSSGWELTSFGNFYDPSKSLLLKKLALDKEDRQEIQERLWATKKEKSLRIEITQASQASRASVARPSLTAMMRLSAPRQSVSNQGGIAGRRSLSAGRRSLSAGRRSLSAGRRSLSAGRRSFLAPHGDDECKHGARRRHSRRGSHAAGGTTPDSRGRRVSVRAQESSDSESSGEVPWGKTESLGSNRGRDSSRGKRGRGSGRESSRSGRGSRGDGHSDRVDSEVRFGRVSSERARKGQPKPILRPKGILSSGTKGALRAAQPRNTNVSLSVGRAADPRQTCVSIDRTTSPLPTLLTAPSPRSRVSFFRAPGRDAHTGSDDEDDACGLSKFSSYAGGGGLSGAGRRGSRAAIVLGGPSKVLEPRDEEKRQSFRRSMTSGVVLAKEREDMKAKAAEEETKDAAKDGKKFSIRPGVAAPAGFTSGRRRSSFSGVTPGMMRELETTTAFLKNLRPLESGKDSTAARDERKDEKNDNKRGGKDGPRKRGWLAWKRRQTAIPEEGKKESLAERLARLAKSTVSRTNATADSPKIKPVIPADSDGNSTGSSPVFLKKRHEFHKKQNRLTISERLTHATKTELKRRKKLIAQGTYGKIRYRDGENGINY